MRVSKATLTGSRVRERRLTLGMRQAAVAKSAGISASYLNLIEHNRRRIGPDVLARLAQALADVVGQRARAVHQHVGGCGVARRGEPWLGQGCRPT